MFPMPPTLARGALFPRLDLRAARYEYQRLAPTAINLREMRSLTEWRSAIANQSSDGQCVGETVTRTAEMVARRQGRAVVDLSPDWVWYYARKLHGWEHQNTGIYPNEGFDVALAGIPSERVFPRMVGSDYTIPPGVDADAPNQDWILAHRPFSIDSRFAESVWSSLDQGQPVAIASSWPDPWFAPDERGVLPDVVSPPRDAAGHEFDVHSWFPVGVFPGQDEPYLGCDNSWDTSWNSQVARMGHGMVAGSFLVRLSTAMRMFVDARSVSPEPLPVPPPPPPLPPGWTKLEVDMHEQAHRAGDPVRALERQNPGNLEYYNQRIGADYVRDAVEAVWKAAGRP